MFEPTTQGDFYMITMSATVDPASGTTNDIHLEVSTDETSSPKDIQHHNHWAITKSGDPDSIGVTFGVYADANAMANGIKFFVETDINCDFYDLEVLIAKVSDGAA